MARVDYFDNQVIAIGCVRRRFFPGQDFAILFSDGKVYRTKVTSHFNPLELSTVRPGDRVGVRARGTILLGVEVVHREGITGWLDDSESGFTSVEESLSHHTEC